MLPAPAHTLSTEERLRGRSEIARLLKDGHRGSVNCLKYNFLPNNGRSVSRVLVSVPKRSFKRAVKRNLLKRRIRECYRQLKDRLVPGTDVMFVYSSREILPYEEILSAMEAALDTISCRISETPEA